MAKQKPSEPIKKLTVYLLESEMNELKVYCEKNKVQMATFAKNLIKRTIANSNSIKLDPIEELREEMRQQYKTFNEYIENEKSKKEQQETEQGIRLYQMFDEKTDRKDGENDWNKTWLKSAILGYIMNRNNISVKSIAEGLNLKVETTLNLLLELVHEEKVLFDSKNRTYNMNLEVLI